MHHTPHEKRTPKKYTKKLVTYRALAHCHGPYGAMAQHTRGEGWADEEVPPSRITVTSSASQEAIVRNLTSVARQEAHFRSLDLARLNELCLRSSFDKPKGHRT